MKASELRLGNWIEVYSSEFQVNEIDIGILFFDFLKNPDGTNFEYDYIDPEFAKPISITEDWLVKFGFVEMEGRIKRKFVSPPGPKSLLYSRRC